MTTVFLSDNKKLSSPDRAWTQKEFCRALRVQDHEPPATNLHIQGCNFGVLSEQSTEALSERIPEVISEQSPAVLSEQSIEMLSEQS